jgi:hypothetical protein
MRVTLDEVENCLTRIECGHEELLSPNLGITKDMTSCGPQVVDMEYRETS